MLHHVSLPSGGKAGNVERRQPELRQPQSGCRLGGSFVKLVCKLATGLVDCPAIRLRGRCRHREVVDRDNGDERRSRADLESRTVRLGSGLATSTPGWAGFGLEVALGWGACDDQ